MTEEYEDIVTTEDYPEALEPTEEQEAPPHMQLLEILQAENVAELLDDQELTAVGQKVVRGYEADKDSRSQWEQDNEEAMKLAKLITEDKSFPWDGAANVKYPLITEAVYTFAARAYPEIVRGNRVVKAEVSGADPEGEKADRAERVGAHMSWQLLTKMDWEEDTDQLLVQLPLVGAAFRKTYYDPIKRQNVARLVLAENMVIDHRAARMDDLRRETEILEGYCYNDILERERAGQWLKLDSIQPDDTENDEDPRYTFIEQHCWHDLDGDGYEEPYVVTVHHESGRVARIVPRFDLQDVILNSQQEVVRINGERHYTRYSFLPNPDGGLYGVGFGILLKHHNESINTVLNQLLDSGTLSNVPGGFIAKGIRVKGGKISLAAGEWKYVETAGGDLRQSILPNPTREPSLVLFNLLGMLVDAGKSIANIKDILSGEASANMPATTVLALIEQGQKVYSSINKRIYRAMRQEFQRLYKLNRDHLDQEEYFQVLDEQQAIAPQDYADDYDISPVADPASSSSSLRMARAQALLQVAPSLDQTAVIEEYLDAIGIDNPQRFMPKPQEPDPMVKTMQMLELAKVEGEAAKIQAEIKKTHADALYSLARAEAEEEGAQMEVYVNQLRGLVDDLARAEQRQQEAIDASRNAQPGTVGGVANAPRNPVALPGGGEGIVAPPEGDRGGQNAPGLM